MISTSFTKLFTSITDSSIWSEDSDTKVVWVTMLAMSDQFGRISAAIPGLAKRANVSIEATEKALNKFLSPDPYSRTKDQEGRRILVIEGGWRLINHEIYRDLRSEEDRKEQNRQAQQRARERKKTQIDPNSQQNVSIGQQKSAESAHTDTDTDTDTDKNKIYSSTKTDKNSKEEEKVLTYLNQKAGTSYRPVQGTLKHIAARLKEGATVEECFKVIDIKVQEWKNDPKMSKYLRTATLFNSEKFHSYSGQTNIIKKPSQSWDSVEPFVASNI